MSDTKWFAPEEEGRTEKPTERKIKKSRKEGRVARSGELTAVLVIVAGVAVIAFWGSHIVADLLDMIRYFIGISISLDVTDPAVSAVALGSFFKAVLPIMAAVVIIALFVEFAQVGFVFSWKTLRFDISRIKKQVPPMRSIFTLCCTILKVLAVGFILFLNLRGEMGRLTHLLEIPVVEGFRFISILILKVLLEASLAFLFIAVLDYMFARKLYMDSLMMSRRELLEEMKEENGDPVVMKRLDDYMGQAVRKSAVENISSASVLLLDRGRYAVAVGSMDSPVVVAKGAGNIAVRITAAAEEAGVPVVIDRYLAEMLYKEAETRKKIPDKYYSSVNAVLGKLR